MENWQIIISICAGIITIITLFDKIGLFKSVKKVDNTFKEIKEVFDKISNIEKDLEEIAEMQPKQSKALLSLLRNELYQCFKEYREIGAWSDDDCRVQAKIHDAYTALNGNGEESIWWEKKKQWKILPEEEVLLLLKKNNH